MGAEIFRQIVKARNIDGVSVDCFGTNPYYPDNPDVKRLREAAVTEVMGGFNELSHHIPKGIEDTDLQSHDTLVMLNPEDVPTLEDQVTSTGTQPKLIIWDIEDPFRKPLAKYIESARTMKAAIERNFNHLSGDTE